MTDISLREYIERMLDDLDRRYDQRFHAADIALQKAERALAEYKVGSNEWRDALKDMANNMATRTDLERVSGLVEELRREKANQAGQMAVIGAICGAITAGVVTWLI